MIYDLELNKAGDRYDLRRVQTAYTSFGAALDRIAEPNVGPVDEFIKKLQAKLQEKLESKPDTQVLDLGA